MKRFLIVVLVIVGIGTATRYYLMHRSDPVSEEIVDLGNGKGLVRKKYIYDRDGHVVKETLFDPKDDRLLGTVDHYRDPEGNDHVKVTEFKRAES